MADTLESLEIKVVHSASGADAEISNLASAIGRLKTAITGAPAALKELASAVKALHDACKGGTAKFDKFAESMANVAASAELVGGNSEHMKTLAEAMNTMSGVKLTAGAFNSLSKGVESVGTAAKTITPEAIENLDKMVTSLAKLQGVDLQGLGSAMNAVRRGGNIKPAETPTPVPQGLQDIISSASAIDVLEAKLESLRIAMDEAFASGNTDKAYQLRGQILQTEAALEKAKKAAEGAAKGVKEVAKEAKKSQTPLSNFINSLKRIAMYRILRSIIKSITQAFQEGLEKAYIFSAGIDGQGHRFAEAMDSIKSATNQMKGQLGSAFISLLAAIQPILITIINLVTKVADAISQLFAAFTGRTYLKANATAAQFADTMASGAGSAKEWKNQLMRFDEINRLNEPNSGGGGGGTNPLAGYEFVDSPINQKLLDFINNLKEKLAPAVERCKEAFDRLKEAWDRFIENFDGSLLSQFFSDLLALPIEAIANTLTVVFDTLTLILDVLNAINTGDWSQVWFDFKQLLYDVVVLVMDLFVGLTNIVMDALIAVAGAIDSVIGTHLADYLQADKDAFNEMYTASRDSEDGLWGLKRVLGLTETSTEKLAEEAQDLTVDLKDVGTEADDLNARVSGVRGAVDWVLDGFRDFGTEVGWIITSLFQPLADLCAWIDSALQGFNLLSFQRVNSPTYDVWSDPTMWTNNFASGGFPDEGQLFMAREAGPELVGTMGGHTAVANNQEIVEGIRQGVYDAVVAANGNGNSEVDVKVYLDSREIKAGQERLARAWG